MPRPEGWGGMLSDQFLLDFAVAVSRWFEFAGIAVIVGGTLVAIVRVPLTVAGLRQPDDTAGRQGLLPRFRKVLGRSILTGLELLVAEDIIRTVAVEPTLRSVLVLGLIVIIRTFLSMSLEVEIDGRWPWQRGRSGER